MHDKKIEELNLDEIKKELVESRLLNERVLQDFKYIIGIIHKTMQKYVPRQINFLHEYFPVPEEIFTKNDHILYLLKSKGPLTSDRIISKLISEKIFDNTDGAQKNIRSRLSNLARIGYIKQDGKGRPYKLIKELPELLPQ